MTTPTNTTLPASRDSHLLEQMRAALSGCCRMADRLARECATTIASNALGDICTQLDCVIGELEAAADTAWDDEEDLRAEERRLWFHSYKRA